MEDTKRRTLGTWGCGIFLSLFLLLIWWFYTLHAGAFSDAWVVYYRVSMGDVWRGDYTRIFGDLPTALAHAIDPELFAGAIVLLYVSTLVRALCVAFLVTRLFGSITVAFIVALLYSTAPNEATIFWPGSLGVHMGTTFVLLASTCLTLGMDQDRDPKFKAVLVGLAWTLLLVSLLTYPGSFMVAAAVPLVLAGIRFYRSPALLGWCSIIGATGTVYLFAMLHGSGRNSRVADLNPFDILNTYFFQAQRFLAEWYDAFVSIVDREPMFVAALLLASLLCVCVLDKTERYDSDALHMRSTTGLVIGFMIYIAALGPFALADVRYQPIRVMVLANFGLYVIIVALVGLSVSKVPHFRYARVISWFAVCMLLTVSAARATEVATEYRRKSTAQQELIARISALVPSLPPDRLLLIHFEDPRYRRQVVGFANRPQWPLGFFYHSAVNAVSIPQRGKRTSVEFTESGVTRRNARGKETTYLWEDVYLLNVTGAGDVELADCLGEIQALENAHIDACFNNTFEPRQSNPKRCALERRYGYTSESCTSG